MIDNEDAAMAWVKSQPEGNDLAIDRLMMLIGMLRAENARQNLIAKASMEHVWQRHIADSAQLLAHVPRGTVRSWLDLGTGAGFPGLVIAILQPTMRTVLVESRRRRIEWLVSAVETLDLPNCVVAGSRLELIQPEAFDCISARAFAPLDTLLKLSAPFSTKRTVWLLPKGRSAVQELAELHGWHHAFHVEQSLTDPDAGIVVGTLAGRKGSKP